MNLPLNSNEVRNLKLVVNEGTPVPVAVAEGDGIGPEIMDASLRVLEAAGAKLDVRRVSIGEQEYKNGVTSGIPTEAMDAIKTTGLLYKAPITTPQGGGYKSLNVTLRKTFSMFANVRPSVSLAPIVPSPHRHMDVVVIRENEEDLYAGIEHRQTDDVYQCLKLVSRKGSERIIRYAFEYARAHGRKKVSCFSKDNIMKLTDGLFHKVFDEVKQDYPDIESDHWIIDIGSARLAANPSQFDVIVTGNLYGDIISDIASEITGSVGIGASYNRGYDCAMFEAVHGSAPDIAGQDIANPSGLLLAGVMMLNHVGQHDVAVKVHNAWLKTIDDGLHTADLKVSHVNERHVGTKEFADAVIDRLGEEPRGLKPVRPVRTQISLSRENETPIRAAEKTLKGVDIFAHHAGAVDQLAEKLNRSNSGSLGLKMISNRGVKVWPMGDNSTLCADHWRCRFMGSGDAAIDARAIPQLMNTLFEEGVDVVKTENLYEFDGQAGYSLAQGQ
jgi:isocitrate dehydrogenase